MEQDKAFLGKEPIGKLLLKLALPTVAAQMINMLYNLVDRIYIGHIPNVGVSALAGVGVCMPLIMLVSAFAAASAMIKSLSFACRYASRAFCDFCARSPSRAGLVLA